MHSTMATYNGTFVAQQVARKCCLCYLALNVCIFLFLVCSNNLKNILRIMNTHNITLIYLTLFLIHTAQILQTQLEAEMNREHPTLPCAFIIFRTLRMATTAAQLVWDNCLLGMNTAPAPEVSNVIWNNLSSGLWRRYEPVVSLSKFF